MAYSTTTDLLARVTAQTLVQLTDRGGTGNVDETIVGSAIADSDSMINAMIAPLYQVPLTSVPPVIKELSATMAVYRLHLFRSIDPGVWKDEYERALTFLRSVAEGKAKLEGVLAAPPTSGSLSDSVDFSSNDRSFSRDDLKEW